jgi:DNA-binding LytR/AlgR family response regulator
MNVINGIDVGLKIREEMDNQTTQIVYMSVSESYYRDLFRVRPTNFLGKPIMKEKIIEELRKAQKLAGKLSGVFTYKKGHDTYKIPIKKIIYFESIDREIKLISTDGEDSFYGSIDVVFTEVKKYHFMRIHRSYLINYFHVAKFSYAEIKMSNSTTLPISKSHQKWIRALQSEWEEEGL